MIGYPLDSRVTYDKDGIPIYDRAVTSAPLRKLTKSLFSDGVLPNPSTNLQVMAKGEKIIIKAGFALCDGCQKLQEEDLELKLPEADNVNDRIDTVVLRLDNNEDVRSCEFYIISGIAASSPVRPILARSESIWEIGLADIRRKSNSTEITNTHITDTRYETERCGIISSISKFDTTTLYQQIQDDLEFFQNVKQEEFNQWFVNIQNVLSDDVAGNLLNMINEVKDNMPADILNSLGELIPENVDLNTYITPGVYRSQNTDKTATLTNAPFSMGFKLIVMVSYSRSIVTQIAMCQGSIDQSIKYRASKDGNSEWTQWQDFVYIHPTSSGNRHIPSGGKSGQFLKWGYDGGATWVSDLDTAAAIKANTNSGRGAGALGVKELYTELKTSFQDGCDTIVSGITAQGVTPASNSPADIKTAINTLATNKYNAGASESKVGTAAPGQVLEGKTFTNASTVGATGTMPNKGGTTQDATPSSDANNIYLPIPASGYYNTSSKLKCKGILHMSFNNGLTAQTGNQTITHSREWTAEMTGRLTISMMYTSFAGIANTQGTCSCTVDGAAQTPTRDSGSGWDRVVVYSMYVTKGQKVVCTGTLPETGNATHSVGQSWSMCYVS